uniref:rhodanese-like domain-containing protein n=1 Tax=Roseivirga sp. TaxID=1964215 RepID=UPI0040478060
FKDAQGNALNGVKVQLVNPADGSVVVTGFTNAQGTFADQMQLASYITEVVLEANYIGIPNAIGLPVKSNSIELQYLGENPSITQLIDYEAFCGMAAPQVDDQSISVHELNELLKSEHAPFLLDVRETYEYEIANLGAHNIPLDELKDRLSEIPKLQAIVVHCKSGARSEKAIQLLREEGFANLKNLEGGILAWQQEIDNKLEIY